MEMKNISAGNEQHFQRISLKPPTACFAQNSLEYPEELGFRLGNDRCIITY